MSVIKVSVIMKRLDRSPIFTKVCDVFPRPGSQITDSFEIFSDYGCSSEVDVSMCPDDSEYSHHSNQNRAISNPEDSRLGFIGQGTQRLGGGSVDL